MGYPMTFKRVINRNQVSEGGYGDWPKTWPAPNLDKLAVATNPDWYIDAFNGVKQRVGALLGDLRRLETDAVDENATCKAIALRTGIDEEIVAAVLKEFMQW